MAKQKQQTDADGNSNPETLFAAVQTWADKHYPPKRGQAMHPGSARIFYFGQWVFLRHHPQAQITPDMPASAWQAQRFLGMLPRIAKHLADDFKRAVRLRDKDPRQSGAEMDRFLRGHLLITAPRLNWATEHTVGIHDQLRQQLQNLWGKCWREAEQDHKARLWLWIERFLLVTPVARPSDTPEKAQDLLLKQLEADKLKGIPPQAYCYGEPLDEWLLSPLLTVPWFFTLCEALAELAQAVPALVRSRAAELAAKGSDAAPAQDDPDTPRQENQQRVPPMPQGAATAAAIGTYALLAWQLSAGAAGNEALLSDTPRSFSLAEFQTLVTLALKATELLLWDDTLPLRPLPPQSPERRGNIRQALLPSRLRKLYEDLIQRAQRYERSSAAPLPHWEEWETTLEAAITQVEQGLDQSIQPAAITSASLHDLLRQPHTALAGQYWYQVSLRDWLRGLLSSCALDGAALLAYCQRIAGALGPWPPTTRGAPASAEQAGYAICWFTKRFLEAKIDNPSIEASTASRNQQPQALPQRADGGLAIWLGSGPLPPEALELTPVVAALIGHALYESCWEAARQGRPLFAAALKEGDPESIERLLKQLEQRARGRDLPNAEEAATATWEKLQQILYHFASPAEINEAHLKGDRAILTALDIFDKVWYIPSTNDYEFTGSISSFANNFIRYSIIKDQVHTTIPEDMPAGPPQTSVRTFDPQEEDRAALEILALIVAQAQRAGRAALAGNRTDIDHAQSDVWLLIQNLFAHNTGRQLVQRFARQGEQAAEAMLDLWQQQLAATQEDSSIIRLYKQPDSIEQNAALARLLLSPAVQQSPERRRAVADLFERPMRLEAIEQSGQMSLGELERHATWALRARWRAETLHALGALDGLAPRQRQMLGAHLLAQEPTALTLKLLEHSGWTPPLWLRIPGPATDANKDNEHEHEEEESRQLFLVARRNWMKQLAGSAASFRARALAAEWLGHQFWDRPWRDRLNEQPYAPFYRTLLAALPQRLVLVLQAAWAIAAQQKLASLSELLGVTGCLPPALPAQIDHRFFFEMMLRYLEDRNEQPAAPNGSRARGAAMPAELRQLRRELRSIRWRTFTWFQALGGLADDNQQRIVLAAMSVCAGKADQLNQWIEGQISSHAQALLAEESKRWHHQSTITEQHVPALMQTAAAEVKSVWEQLRRPPHFWQADM